MNWFLPPHKAHVFLTECSKMSTWPFLPGSFLVNWLLSVWPWPFQYYGCLPSAVWHGLADISALHSPVQMQLLCWQEPCCWLNCTGRIDLHNIVACQWGVPLHYAEWNTCIKSALALNSLVFFQVPSQVCGVWRQWDWSVTLRSGHLN